MVGVRECQFSLLTGQNEEPFWAPLRCSDPSYLFSPNQSGKYHYRCVSSISSAQNGPAVCWGPAWLEEGKFHCWALICKKIKPEFWNQWEPGMGQQAYLPQIPLVCSMKPHTVMEPALSSQGTWHHPAGLATKAQADWKRGSFSQWLVTGKCLLCCFPSPLRWI